jgi:hypothetical protein
MLSIILMVMPMVGRLRRIINMLVYSSTVWPSRIVAGANRRAFAEHKSHPESLNRKEGCREKRAVILKSCSRLLMVQPVVLMQYAGVEAMRLSETGADEAADPSFGKALLSLR